MSLPQDELFKKCLLFLYQQVEDGKIPQIKKTMAQDLYAFVEKIVSERENMKMAQRMSTEQEKILATKTPQEQDIPKEIK